MRRSTLLTLVGLLSIGLAGSAGAATLSFTGEFELRYGILPSWVVPGSGLASVGITGANHLASLALPSGAFGPATLTVPWTSNPSTRSVQFTLSQNGAGSFTGLSGMPPGGGTMGISGLAKLCLPFGGCDIAAVTVPLAPTPSGAGFGIGGTVTKSGAIAFTLQHASWTIGQPVMTIHTANSNVTSPALPGGFAHGPASLTSDTAQPSGALQLVTVSKVYTSLGGLPELPLTGVLTLHFVPEPGAILMLGSGIMVLAIYGRRRRRR